MTAAMPIVRPTGFSHVRLTVSDIDRSKAFYQQLFGAPPSIDFSDQADEPGVRDDPDRLYGGCLFTVGSALLGLRPVARADDSFQSTRVGLDHVSMQLGSMAELRKAAELLDKAGFDHGEVKTLDDLGVAILSVQDPDDINLEVSAALDD